MIKKIFILVIVVVAVGVGGYFLINQEESLKNPEAVKDMIRIEENMNNLDSYTTAMELELKFNEQSQDYVSFVLNIDMDKKNEAMEATGSIVASVEGMNFDLNAELIHINDNLYGKINNINLPPLLLMFFPIDQSKIELISNKDILLKENLFQDLNQMIAEITQEIGQESLTIEEIITEMEGISRGFWQQGVTIIENVSVDELDGQEVNKYKIKIDNEKLISFILNYLEEKNLFDLISDINNQDKEEIIKEIKDTIKDDQAEIDFYIWADENYILKSSYRSEIKIPEEETQASEKMILLLNVYYSNFNHEFDIIEPENYLLLDELIKIFEDIFDIPETGPVTI